MKTIGAILLTTLLLAGAAWGAAFDHGHTALNPVLKRFVKDALVDYAALKADPKELDAYLSSLASVSEGEFRKWTEPQQLAFLINLYNAATLRLIIDHYPIKSIRKIGGWFSGPWNQPVVPLFGQAITLDKLEHQILRHQYTEPRIHFAIVCGALGCPPLRSEAYTAGQLEVQLEAQGRQFLGTARKNSFDYKTRTLNLSPIFKWFATDFEQKSGSVIKFVRPYFPPAIQAELDRGGFKVRHTDYDWALNEAARR